MPESAHASIILAAGKGTRMRSAQPKALHRIAGCTMLGHVMRVVGEAGQGPVVVVVGPDMDAVADASRAIRPDAAVSVQPEQRGTADAVSVARAALDGFDGPAIVLAVDTPLITPGTVGHLIKSVSSEADVTVLGFRPVDPTGYGRILNGEDGKVTAIREHADCTPDERAVGLCNAGAMAFRSAQLLFDLIDKVGTDNAQGEYYLTDVVEIAVDAGLTVDAGECPEDEVLGINTRAQLAQAEAAFQDRLRAAAMEAGTTLVDPSSVFLSHDTVLGADVVVEPHVVFGPGVTVEDGATVRAFSHVEAATVRSGATVGPFARLRPGADIGAGARIGNFVEVKNAVVEQGAKVNHLAYVGDAHVGVGANVGAGTITCNYDGFAKHHTEIGAGAFIGSNSALVAPVTIADGAYVASGSVVTKNVAEGALAVGRGRQIEIPGWVERFRSRSKK